MEEKSNVAKVHKSVGTYKFRIEGYSGFLRFCLSLCSIDWTRCISSHCSVLFDVSIKYIPFVWFINAMIGLSSRVGESVESPEFFICGHQWQLRIFPGGSLVIFPKLISFLFVVFYLQHCDKHLELWSNSILYRNHTRATSLTIWLPNLIGSPVPHTSSQ